MAEKEEKTEEKTENEETPKKEESKPENEETPKKEENKPDLSLYYMNGSYYSNRAILALLEKKLAFKQEIVKLYPNHENLKPEYLKLNPKGEVPTLVHDGKAIPDSDAIVRHLEEHLTSEDHPTLYPADIKQEVEDFCKRVNALAIYPFTFGAPRHPEFGAKPKPPFNSALVKFATKKINQRDKIIKEVIEKYPEFGDVLKEKLETNEVTQKQRDDPEEYKKVLDEVDAVCGEVEELLGKQEEGATCIFGSTFTAADIYFAVLLHRINMLGYNQRFWKDTSRPKVEGYYTKLQERDTYKELCTLAQPKFPLPMKVAIAVMSFFQR